ERHRRHPRRRRARHGADPQPALRCQQDGEPAGRIVMQRKRPNILGGLGGWLWLLVTIVPIYYIVITSLRPQSDYYDENPLSIPSNPTLDPYQLVIENEFVMYLTNSLLVTAAAVAAILAVSLMASYYLVRAGTRLAQ